MSGESRAPDNGTSPTERVDTTLVASRYEIQELLGRGSMGAVYCARDVVLDRPVALKLFPAEATDQQQAVRYEQEARLLARLSHPGLVTVYDAGIDASITDAPRPYLVMELVRGPTLADRLRDGPLPPADVSAMAVELASALAHIHRREVVHRDVKPANILLRAPEDGSRSPTATLTDFGIARLIDGSRITVTGYTLGTANYLSPEQLNGADVAAPSDIYSLGLVLLECLTGKIAYPGHGVEAALPRLHHGPEIPDSVPPGWARLLRAMTDLEPSARPAAGEIAAYIAPAGAVDSAPPLQPPVIDDQPTLMGLPVAAPPVPDVEHTRVLPTVGAAHAGVRSDRRHWLRSPAMLILGLAALTALIFVVVYAVSSTTGGKTPPAPGYPSVTGPIGNHLRQLQQDIAP